MATQELRAPRALGGFSPRRLVIAGGFALAVAAAPAFAAFTVPVGHTAPLADCPGGEEADQFTGNCVPHTVPNSGVSPFSTDAANPDVPEIDGVPCTGADSGACIGLAENAPAYVPPTSTIGSSPTVYGVS